MVVALTALWLYDYILSIPDTVELIIESQWGLGMFLYLACSHLPFVCVSLNVLTGFQPDAPLLLCHSYNIANICIFALRAFAVWERERWPTIFAIINIINLTRQSLKSGYEVEVKKILVLLLYRAVKGHGGWKTDNRLMCGLILSSGIRMGKPWGIGDLTHTPTKGTGFLGGMDKLANTLQTVGNNFDQDGSSLKEDRHTVNSRQ
ncbi:hypothetical protein BDR03DRAFT_1042142 [Suillus americanus]|nr:hypothetical protein BDR03DRAFT_1042142 [Suillus americanus]